MTAPARPPLAVTRVAGDPLAVGDPALIAAREHLGARLAAAAEAAPDAERTPEADVDLIVRYADAIMFDPGADDARDAFAALARVTGALARLPGGIDFAGRHWCTGQPCARHPEPGSQPAPPAAPPEQRLRKSTGSYYTAPELIAELLSSSLPPQIHQALTADGTTRTRPLISTGTGTHYTEPRREPAVAEQALAELTVCDPACGAGAFLVAAARLLSWYVAMYRAGRDGSIDAELPAARRDVVTQIYGVDLSPLAVDLTRLVLAAEAAVPGRPTPYLGYNVKCGNSLIGTTPALLAQGIPDGAYKPLPGDDPQLAAAARRRNKAERDAWRNGLPAAGPRPEPRPIAALARAAEWTSPEQAHRELENSPEVRRAKRIADAWCAAFMWPHEPDGPGPVTTGTLLHLAAGGTLEPDAEDTLAALARQHQFFHWHLEFPGVFRAPERPAGREAA